MKIILCAFLSLSASMAAMDIVTIEPKTVHEELSEIIVNGTATTLEAFLLAHPECDINSTNTVIAGYTPLQVACYMGNSATSAVLINRGASLKALAERKSPFRLAAKNGMRATCELLMEKDPSILAVHGEAVVKTAIARGHTSIFLLCIEQEVTIDYKEALYKAAELGHQEIVDVLLQRVLLKPDAKLLHAAARGGLIDLCIMLLDNGTPINETDKVGYNALLCAQNRLSMAKDDGKKRRLQAVCDLLVARGGTDTWVDPKHFTDTWKFYCGMKLCDCGTTLLVLYKKITASCKGCRKDKKQ